MLLHAGLVDANLCSRGLTQVCMFVSVIYTVNYKNVTLSLFK